MKTLYRPVNLAELDLIKKSGMKAFPSRLPEQPIFYPVTNVEYARQITVDWNVPAYGIGYVLAFDLDEKYLNRFQIQNVGGPSHDELWVPAEDLEDFNKNIIGVIRIIEMHEK